MFRVAKIYLLTCLFQLNLDFVLIGSYIVARNATPGLYSFFPWHNRQMWIVWLSLGFIVFSQVFVIVSFGYWFPPSVKTDVEWIACRGSDSDPDACNDLSDPGDRLVVDVHGETVSYHRVEHDCLFHNHVFSSAPWSIQLLRLLAFSWILSGVRFFYLHVLIC